MSLNGDPIEVDTRKAIALLAYLSVEGDATRDTLATLFWADSPSDRARATLRRTLSALRSGIGSDAITADRNRVSLDSSSSSDLSAFDAEIRSTFEHDHDPSDVCNQCVPPLTRATDLYRGDFLEGFSVRDAPEFEDWARNVTEDLRLRAGAAFNRLAMGRAASGDYAGAIAAVTRWIELDVLHEPAHRLLMLLNAWAGDRPGAVEAYRAFVAVLDSELGVPPLEETTELYEAILDEDLPPAPGARKRVQTHQAGPPPADTEMLDRESELNALRSAQQATEIRGQVAAIIGGAWMGKTKLLEVFTSEADISGDVVLFGRAFRMEQTLPYGVITQILGAAVPLIDSMRDRVPEWAFAETARLVPQLATGQSPITPDRFGELHLLEGVQAVLAEIARDRRLVVVVDDIQWVDPASAGVLTYLARRIDKVRSLLVIAARSGEPLDQPIRELLGQAATQIELEPLPAGAIDDLVPDGLSAVDVIRRTGGVPLLVLEALSHETSSTESPGVMRYMETRLRDLTDLGRQILGTAAVLDGLCDASLLRETSGRSEEEVVEAVEELARAGLLREVPDSDGLSFTLDALEKITYDSASLIRRRLLHRRAAEALEKRPRSKTDARLAAAIAAHRRGAGNEEAADWYHLAGDLSREVYANSEATNFYETSIALGYSDPVSLRLSLGEVAMARGDYTQATRDLTAAAAQADGPTLGLILHRLGEVQRLLGRFERAEDHFQLSAPLHPEPAGLYADWALLNHRIGDAEQARALSEQALALAIETGVDSDISRAQNILGVVSDDPAEATEHLAAALALAGDDDLLRMAALNNQAHRISQTGEIDAAVDLVEDAIAIAARTGHRHREAALHNHLADLHHLAGNRQDAEAALTAAVTIFADVDSGAWEPEVWLLSQW